MNEMGGGFQGFQQSRKPGSTVTCTVCRGPANQRDTTNCGGCGGPYCNGGENTAGRCGGFSSLDLGEDERQWCYNCDPKAPPELAEDRRRLRGELMDSQKRRKRIIQEALGRANDDR